MLNIERVKDIGKKKGYLIVNGVPDEYSFYGDFSHKSAHFYDPQVIDDINSHSLFEVADHFDEIDYTYDLSFWAYSANITIYLNPYEWQKYRALQIELRVETDLWAAGWSLKEFSDTLREVVSKPDFKNVTHFQSDDDFVSNGFGLEFTNLDFNDKLDNVIDSMLNIAADAVARANSQLELNAGKESLITFFDFPENIKVPCRQYLMYFAQFLKDLGIEAETEIKDYNNSTLFKVIPNDKAQALERIKEALDSYISCPGIKELQFQEMHNGDIAFIQLQANIMHLKSQLMFLNTALKMKDATIETLEISNYQLKNIVAKLEANINQEEEVIPGIVSLKKYEGDGFSVNLPEILKRLKRTFKR